MENMRPAIRAMLNSGFKMADRHGVAHWSK